MQETKEATVVKKKLTPESTILLTIGGVALIAVVWGIIHWIITGA